MRVKGLVILFCLALFLLPVGLASEVRVHYKNAVPTDQDSNPETAGIESELYGFSSAPFKYEYSYGVQWFLQNQSVRYFPYNFTNPGDTNEWTYSWDAENITYEWITLDNPTTLNLGDDELSDAINMDLYMVFMGTQYYQLKISSNGFITFNTSSTNHGCCSGEDLPNAADPNAIVAGIWEDLRPASGGGSGTIKYQKFTISGDPYFVIQYDGVEHYDFWQHNQYPVSFQIVVYNQTQ